MPAIRGIVINSNSRNPVARATVYTDSGSVPGWDSQHAISAGDGTFELLSVPPGTYTLRAQTEAIAIDRYNYSFFGKIGPFELSSNDISVEITVDVRGLLHGKVKDALSGNPVRGAVIRCAEETGGMFRAVSEQDGTFSMGQIIPKTYTIFCEAQGYERFQQKIFVPDAIEQAPVVLPVFLTPLPSNLTTTNGLVRGFVYNEMGNPALNATVTLKGDCGSRTVVTLKNYFDYETGNYEFYDVPEGKYLITVVKPGMHPASAEIEVIAGKANWAPDIKLAALPVSTPPEIEYLKIEPTTIISGQQLHITVKFRGALAKVAAASATIFGSGGYSIGFAFERRSGEGDLQRVFEWTQPGTFILTQLMVHNTDTGKGFEVPVQAQFEVLPRQVAPLNPDSAIFRVSR